MLTPNSGAIVPVSGFRRTYPYPLLATTASGLSVAYRVDATGETVYYATNPGTGYTVLPAALRVVTVPAEAIGREGGIGIAVVNEATHAVVAVAFHPGGLQQDPTTDPYPIPRARLNMLSANDVPTILVLRDRTLIVTPGDVTWVWDGATFRQAGLPDPRFKPCFTVSNAVVPGTEGAYALGLKYTGTAHADAGFSMDPVARTLRLYSNTGAGTLDGSAIDLTGQTYTQLLATINGKTGWAAVLGTARYGVTDTDAGTQIVGSDSHDVLMKTLALVEKSPALPAGTTVRDVTLRTLSTEVQSRAGALIPLYVPDAGVAMRLEQTAGGASPRFSLSAGDALLKLWNDHTGAVGTHTDIALGSNKTWTTLVSDVAAVTGWKARLESATSTAHVLGSTETPYDVAVTDPESVAVGTFGGSAIALDDGTPSARLDADVKTGVFPFTMTFTARSAGSVATRHIDYGDGGDGDSWGTPVSSWTHTFVEGVDGVTRDGDKFLFSVVMTDTDSSGFSSSAALTITGRYQWYEVQVLPPGQFSFPASTPSNGDRVEVSIDGQGALKTHWAQPIFYKYPGNAVAAHYGEMRVAVRQRATGPVLVAPFRVYNDCSIGLGTGSKPKTWRASIDASISWLSLTTPPMKRVFKAEVKLATDTWRLEYRDATGLTDGRPIPLASDYLLVVKLWSADGTTLLGTIEGAAGLGYIKNGDNVVTVPAAITTPQKIAAISIGFAGAPPHWPLAADGSRKDMMISLKAIQIYDSRYTAGSGETT
jgi:hypothetical protein